MAHRAKHLRRNWVPERLAKAEERRLREEKRQAERIEETPTKGEPE